MERLLTLYSEVQSTDVRWLWYFCFLLKYLFDLPMRVDIVTDDDDQRIDTILDFDNQRQSLKDLAEKYTSIRRKDYLEWRIRLEDEMTKAEEK